MKIFLKTQDEVEKLHAVNRIVATVLDACEAACKPGATTWDLNQVADEKMKSLGATSAFLGYHGYPAVLCTSVNEVVVHGIPRKDLVLKDLGGDEITDDLFLSTWSICGSDYMLTLTRGVVSDVLKMPAHAGTEKEFDGDCTKDKTPVPGVIVGILVDQPGSDALPAKTAWKLDEKTGEFTSISPDGLTCARHDILFPDGGKK